MKSVRIPLLLTLVIIAITVFIPSAQAFCGFYVAKADAKLFNQSSQVAIARNENRTVLTMANDYQGEIKDFAIVIPVPVVLQKEQVTIANPQILERLDAFTAPRLVEYYDPDPCAPLEQMAMRAQSAPAPLAESDSKNFQKAKSLGVTIEARFNVGEYDILILSAKESDGLQTWLQQNGYRIPKGASDLLKPYIRQKLKFFVAKVNLEKFAQSDRQFLRPLQITYESPRFMLPIRLGMINADKEQDLLIYILSPKGQVEVTNYRTVKVPSDVQIPLFVKSEFAGFYKSLFQTAYERADRKVAFMEYAWDMANCDPCSADPLTPDELKQAGVNWQNDGSYASAFVTRLHVRYARKQFPEDLVFQETGNRATFQGRYILNHAFTGELKCQAGNIYRQTLRKRLEEESRNLANLTQWDINRIRERQSRNPA